MIADKIEYIIMLIKLFARRFGLSYMQAFRYVCLHDGIEYAERHYNILHTLTFEDQVEALAAYCHRKGKEGSCYEATSISIYAGVYGA